MTQSGQTSKDTISLNLPLIQLDYNTFYTGECTI